MAKSANDLRFTIYDLRALMETVSIARYSDSAHRAQVVALWKSVFGYEAAHNDPKVVIDKKIAEHDDLFFVAIAGVSVVGTVMAGYDGHRGWIYSLAVSPSRRREGIGSRLTAAAEQALTDRRCVKINLQIMEGNESVAAFYTSLGYSIEKRVSMGKRIEKNVPTV